MGRGGRESSKVKIQTYHEFAYLVRVLMETRMQINRGCCITINRLSNTAQFFFRTVFLKTFLLKKRYLLERLMVFQVKKLYVTITPHSKIRCLQICIKFIKKNFFMWFLLVAEELHFIAMARLQFCISNEVWCCTGIFQTIKQIKYRL